eukprot:TRINITY_DN64961_c0_g1_i1.p1 TRINITY_DN64961_c0_g1~~TRINITY_DN64961_c0_g1_i1.p1  ORF type:complete len:799 (+),score=196.38 TRINITY_DN64961_c0_g1_i1:61-2457(+)
MSLGWRYHEFPLPPPCLRSGSSSSSSRVVARRDSSLQAQNIWEHARAPQDGGRTHPLSRCCASLGTQGFLTLRSPLPLAVMPCIAGGLAVWRRLSRRRKKRGRWRLEIVSLRATQTAGAAPEVDVVASSTEADAAAAAAGGCVFRAGVADEHMYTWVADRLQRSGSGKLLGPELSVSTELLETGVRPGDKHFRRAQLVALRHLLEDGAADFLVVPVKDLPLDLPDGLAMPAVLPRGDPREALLLSRRLPSDVASLADLPEGAMVSAASRQRAWQIKAKHPKLVVHGRETPLLHRLRRFHDGVYDACVVAADTLDRLGIAEGGGADGYRLLAEEEIMPALGQGAVCLLCEEDEQIEAQLANVWDDAATRACVQSERALLRLGRLDAFNGVNLCGLSSAAPEDPNVLRRRCTISWATSTSEGTMYEAATVEKLLPVAEAESDEAVAAFEEDLLARLAAQGDTALDATAEDDASDPAEQLDETEEDAEEEQVAGAEAASDVDSREPVPPIFDAEARFALDAVAATGEAYTGRVCAQTYRRDGSVGGAIIDINCEVPAKWYPERSDDRSKRLEVGTDVQVYCCWRQGSQLRVVLEPPRKLEAAGSEPRSLADLSAGDGPFTATVVSCTASGTLVDFRCEVLGYFLSSRALERGSEIQVYCYKVHAETRTCEVGTQKLPTWSSSGVVPKGLKPTVMRLVDLNVGAARPYRGRVYRVETWGAWIDFDCEVCGRIDGRDIDIDVLHGDLQEGQSITIYVTKVNSQKRQVAVSMFRPSSKESAYDRVPPVRRGASAGTFRPRRGSR